MRRDGAASCRMCSSTHRTTSLHAPSWPVGRAGEDAANQPATGAASDVPVVGKRQGMASLEKKETTGDSARLAIAARGAPTGASKASHPPAVMAAAAVTLMLSLKRVSPGSICANWRQATSPGRSGAGSGAGASSSSCSAGSTAPSPGACWPAATCSALRLAGCSRSCRRCCCCCLWRLWDEWLCSPCPPEARLLPGAAGRRLSRHAEPGGESGGSSTGTVARATKLVPPS